MDIASIRKEFPIFAGEQNKTLVYLDSAATTFKPAVVISAVSEYYSQYSSNIHRGLYPISVQASELVHVSRVAVQKLLNSSKPEEIIFTKGATESLNLLASSLCKTLKPGDEIVTTIADHHSNFVPWQQLAIQNKLKFGIVTFDPLTISESDLIQNIVDSVTRDTAVVTMPFVTNVFGVVLPLSSIILAIRQKNPKTIIIIDACQAVTHIEIDVQKLDCDFLVFSGHKIFGPTGVGVLYGKEKILHSLSPYQYGGDMVISVTVESTSFANIPAKFEAGTPPIAEIIGLKRAVDFLSEITPKHIRHHGGELVEYARRSLDRAYGSKITLYKSNNLKESSILQFNISGAHPHDVAQILGDQNICIRVGHHCAQPLHTYLGLDATCRASFSIYNTKTDIDALVKGIGVVMQVLHIT